MANLKSGALDWCARRERNLWLAAFLSAASVYLLTGTWVSSQISDAYGAAWAGWQLVSHGTFDLATVNGFGSGVPDSYASVGGEVRAARMPGAILAGVPFHALLGWTGATATTSATLGAALLTAAAVANVAVVLCRVASTTMALLGAGTLGFGTAMWTVAADQLWSHGPNAFWLSCALLFVSRGSAWGVGVSLGFAVTTRPHLAVVAACVGMAWAVHDRSWRRLPQVGLPGVGGLAFVYWWNGWYYGSGSVGGGHGYAAGRASRAPWDGGWEYLEALAGTLVSPTCGLFVYTPVALLVALAVRPHRSATPWWVRAFALGGLLYLAVQMRISPHFAGGGGFYGNRYAVETLVLATPFAVHVLRSWSVGSPARTRLTLVLAALSVALHAFAEILSYALIGLGMASPWVAWYPYYIARTAGYNGLLTGVICLLFVILVALLASRRAPDLVLSGAAPVPSPRAAPGAPSSAPPAPPPGAAASPRR